MDIYNKDELNRRMNGAIAALKAEGNLRLACHLIEYAVLVDPESAEVHALRGEIYEARAKLEDSSMARNILNHASLASAEGKRDIALG